MAATKKAHNYVVVSPTISLKYGPAALNQESFGGGEVGRSYLNPIFLTASSWVSRLSELLEEMQMFQAENLRLRSAQSAPSALSGPISAPSSAHAEALLQEIHHKAPYPHQWVLIAVFFHCHLCGTQYDSGVHTFEYFIIR